MLGDKICAIVSLIFYITSLSLPFNGRKQYEILLYYKCQLNIGNKI